jgi:peptide/nickel transport system substrate-binding protein
MRKYFVPLAVLLVLILVLSGCSSASTSAPPTSTSVAPTTQTTTNPPAPTTPATQAPTSTAPLTSKLATTTIAPTPTVKTGGVFRLAYDVTPGSPYGWPPDILGETNTSSQLCLQGLVRGAPDGSSTPLLATSWDIAPDKTSITFHLRKGVKFHDNTDFNAQAVKFNYDAEIAAKKAPYWKSIDVIDDYTVRVNLTRWTNAVMYTFDGAVGSIASPTAFQKNGIDWARVNPVGTGPFVFQKYQQDTIFRATKNPNYWQGGVPYVDEWDMVYVTDNMTQKAVMQSQAAEALDVELGKLTNDFQQLGFKNLTARQAVFALFPDSANADSPWSNVKVRQAAEYAIDREALASGLGFGFLKAPYQIIAANNSAYDPNFAGRKYDVAKAKQLLADAGYPNGFKTTLIPTPAPLNRDMVVAIQSYLAAVGIQCSLEFPEYSKYLTYRTGSWKNAILLDALGAWANYNQAYTMYFDPTNPTAFPSLQRSDAFKATFSATIATTDPDLTLIRKLQSIMFDEAMVIPVYEGGKGYALQNYVRGDVFLQTAFPTRFKPENVWMDK